jgi:phosphatidylglycerol lysyltransferase
MKTQRILIGLIALVTLGSGVATLLSALHPQFVPRVAFLRDAFPDEFLHVSRLLAVVLGLGLVLTSLHILRRKHRAYRTALLISAAAVFVHLMQGRDWQPAALSVALMVVLVACRRYFTVRSATYDLRSAGPAIALIVGAALAYGVGGFWLLDRHQFGLNFTWSDSLYRTLRYFVLIGDGSITPRTHYARWFLQSLYVVSVTTILYVLYSLFRPVFYQYRTHPHELARAAAITARHGRSALDFFKYWTDKSLFFSPTGESFVAYRVAGRYAVVLGDPVGPADEVPTLARDFSDFCRDNDWGLVFHQVPPDLLPVYQGLGFQRLKLGDDAIVDLGQFSLEGRSGKDLRQVVHRMERLGVQTRLIEPPLTDDLLAELETVSDEWLGLPGHRERGFTLGRFEPDYLRATPVFIAVDPQARVLGFMNLIPCFAPGERTIDLMRHRAAAPNGIMDLLFTELFLHLKQQGDTRFNLGLAPMSGFTSTEQATAEERAVHTFLQRLTFLFNYAGLRAYKAKFATSWEPRYLVYKHTLELPAVAIAIGRVSEPARGGAHAPEVGSKCA